MRALGRLLRWAAAIVALAFGVVLALGILGIRRQDLPWTALDLADPIGALTGRRLAGLEDDFATCRALLDRAGIHYAALAPISAANSRCGYANAVRFRPGGSRRIDLSPAAPALACPVAAALALWEWDVLQPAAERTFHAQVVGIDQLGSYNCRRIYGRSNGAWSEHATANAIDIAGFRLSDGRHITVARDWAGDDAAARFLHDARDGACRLFTTVLSPDYNAAHRTHLHLDEAARGAWGARACR